MDIKAELGMTYKDVITQFEGVAIGRADYITGCSQVLLVPQGLTADGKRREGEWFDEQRLRGCLVPKVVIDNGRTPGCDIEAPKR